VNRVPVTLVARTDDAARVRAGAHELRALVAPALEVASGPITLVIRPEAIRIGAADVEENQLAGTISDVTFLGNIVDYQIDIGGDTLRVQGDRRAVMALGSHVSLAVPVAECTVMQDSSASETEDDGR
jgi:hypothetical protein